MLGAASVLFLSPPAAWVSPAEAWPVLGAPEITALGSLLLLGVLAGGLTAALVRARRRVEHEVRARSETEKALAALNDDLQRQIAEQDDLLAGKQAAWPRPSAAGAKPSCGPGSPGTSTSPWISTRRWA